MTALRSSRRIHGADVRRVMVSVSRSEARPCGELAGVKSRRQAAADENIC